MEGQRRWRYHARAIRKSIGSRHIVPCKHARSPSTHRANPAGSRHGIAHADRLDRKRTSSPIWCLWNRAFFGVQTLSHPQERHDRRRGDGRPPTLPSRRRNPVHYRPMFGGRFGRARATSVTFVSQAALPPRARSLGSRGRSTGEKHARLGKKHMLHNIGSEDRGRSRDLPKWAPNASCYLEPAKVCDGAKIFSVLMLADPGTEVSREAYRLSPRAGWEFPFRARTEKQAAHASRLGRKKRRSVASARGGCRGGDLVMASDGPSSKSFGGRTPPACRVRLGDELARRRLTTSATGRPVEVAKASCAGRDQCREDAGRPRRES